MEGDNTSGFFRLTLIDDGQETVLYKETMRTMSTETTTLNAKYRGLSNLQPIKLYTSAWLTEWMKERGYAIEAYFTDWIFDGDPYSHREK